LTRKYPILVLAVSLAGLTMSTSALATAAPLPAAAHHTRVGANGNPPAHVRRAANGNPPAHTNRAAVTTHARHVPATTKTARTAILRAAHRAHITIETVRRLLRHVWAPTIPLRHHQVLATHRRVAAISVAAVSHPVTVSNATSTNTPEWQCILQAESGGNYKASGDEYEGGGWQFSPTTFRSLGYSGYAADYPPAVQNQAALKLYALEGFTPWPDAATTSNFTVC